MFVTDPGLAFSEDVNLNIGGTTKGSARISSSSKSLICTAFLFDTLENPAASMTYLTIVKKVKQKASN